MKGVSTRPFELKKDKEKPLARGWLDEAIAEMPRTEGLLTESRLSSCNLDLKSVLFMLMEPLRITGNGSTGSEVSTALASQAAFMMSCAEREATISATICFALESATVFGRYLDGIVGMDFVVREGLNLPDILALLGSAVFGGLFCRAVRSGSKSGSL